MARVRSVEFLPPIFQTDANKQFLAATLDTLVQEPKFKKTQGYIGSKVGPGVNANDKYVIEPSKARNDYQLEPGVVSLDPTNTTKIQDAITYPGINDALNFQGADVTDPQRLYTSEYYTWDPFIDFDSFVNFSQYFWVPDGPDVVSVYADSVPLSQDFTVTRANGVYTFNGVVGNNPDLTLVRGGNYGFQVTNNTTETVNFRVQVSINIGGASSYLIDYEPNPTLTLARGNTYVFTLNETAAYPFWIKTEPITGVGSAYNTGVTNNGGTIGVVTFVVPQDAPDTLYYSASNNTNLHGQINIVDTPAGTGPGFWIQTAPGVNGQNPVSPNLGTRSVLGVANNGENNGVVTFNVPSKTAQQFYYDLTDIGGVDLLTNLEFSEIDGVNLAVFVTAYGGIDGITDLENRTLVFNSEIVARSIWRIAYTGTGTATTISLVEVQAIPLLNKFTILYGAQYSSTQWFVNNSTFFEQIPLLSAVQDVLYYQDGTDPEIFGRILLIEQANASDLRISDILGKKNYTSPNGVVFTNGLKVKFTGSVVPNSYASGTATVTCNQTLSSLNLITCDSTQNLVNGQTIVFSGSVFGGLTAGATYYVRTIFSDSQFTVSTIPNGSPVLLTNASGQMNGIATTLREYYVSGVGTSIELLPVSNFIVPEVYSSNDYLTVACTNTAAGTNLITCNDTTDLIVGRTIEFAGAVFGGLLQNTPYYVRSIVNSTDFTVSLTNNGSSVNLVTASGRMAATTFIGPGYPDYVTISRASKDLNAWTRSNRWFHIDVLNATGEYNNTTVRLDNNYRAKRPILQFRPGIRLFNMGTEGKQAVNVIDFAETDALSNVEGSTGYVVYGTPYVNVPPSQFKVGSYYKITVLGTTDWNAVAGTVAVDYAVGDTFIAAASGSGTGFATLGYELQNGSRVIFGADTDADVRDKIYVVNFVTPDTVPPLISQPIINLTLADDGQVLIDQSTVCLSSSQVGKTFYYDGTAWILAQQKTEVQQPPLFNVYDADGYSFADDAVYPSSTFKTISKGSKLFSYALNDETGIVDPVLGFKLKYLSLQNVGDIVFDNNLYTDTFNYVKDKIGQTLQISTGCPREYATRTDYVRLLGWQTAVTPTLIRQQFKFTYDGQPLLLDVAALTDQQTIVPAVKVIIGSVFQSPSTYTVITTENTTTITFSTDHVIGDTIEVEVLSNQTSATAFYQVPSNLVQNPLNGNSSTFSLGTIRTHYETICQNLTDLVGPINGSNNSRDLGNIIPYGQLILQQSSPLTLAGYFMRSTKYNIFASLEYNSREYQKYKNQLLEAVTRQTIDYNLTYGQILDLVIGDVIAGRTETNPFYWSDMLPGTQVFTTTNYTVSVTTTNQFNTNQVYNYKSANYLGLNVYINNRLLTRGVDYFVSNTAAVISLSTELFDSLVNGDIISLQEYTETYGTFVPNTPTKLGLYPAWRPAVVPVATSSGTSFVILGHDGSQTPLFGDIRDQILLEFETRIYNNLKLDDNPIPLTITDVLPGQFRTTDYSYTEINNILTDSFLTYVGWNKLDYTTQDYNAGNPFTFNYSQSLDKLNNENLLGAWRGIYRYFYDTQQPEEAPWEMLGFTERPLWWEITYGPAPYTSDNLVLWDDLEAGLVRDPAGDYIKPLYARPGLTRVLPTNPEGELLAPLYSVVGTYPENSFQKSWAVGDGGPVEASWWNSSDYPFAVMRLLALTRPAEFFALFADRDLYRYNTEFEQYLYNNRYRLDANSIEVYGNGVSKASYIDWIVDYNKLLGNDSTQELQNDLANLDVRLCYRMASFSDKQYIKIYTEKSSPASINTSLLIPDESYDLLLYKNQPFDRSTYSSVIIQVVEDGWAVYGYSNTRPFFNTLTSIPAGQFRTFTVGTTTVQVPVNYSQTITQVPYGFVFHTESAVANFLLSYGKLLEQKGFEFNDPDNGYILNWDQMVTEFLYWANQGWGINTLINLNPLAYKLSVFKEQAVVDTVAAQTSENLILDQNKTELPTRDLNIVRLDNNFTIEPLTNQSISYIDMRYTNFESMIVLRNTSLFGDLIYYPITGARQTRLYLSAVTSTEWNGSVDAQGFILNQNNIEEWTGLKIYPKGTIVKYKNSYWSAATIVQPSAKFNYNDWNQSNYTLIQQGLLPNLANKADQLVNSYNINSANLESDNDLLSYGLIGFRPRQYLAALNLDDVSQLNVYRQFLGTKGTILAADLLGNVQLNKERAEYTIYENWAVQRSTYGANANRSFFDLRLNAAQLTSDPALVQVVQPQQSSQADQTVLLSNVWKSSFALTTPDILPTTTTKVTDIGLPTAGYVNLNDADITVFQLSDPASLSANLNTIQNGTSIWVAKVNDYDWNIYRAQFIYGQIQHVCDNLNGTSRVIFSNQHGLAKGDTLIIRFFDTEVNGVYKVLSVSDLFTVNIAFTFESGRTVADGNGIGYRLQTMRVAQASDVIDLPYVKQILPGAKVWVDNNGNDLWQVLEKQNPFSIRTKLEPVGVATDLLYGTGLAQAQDQAALFVGAPGFVSLSNTAGAIYVYLKGQNAQYTPLSPITSGDTVLLLTNTGTRGFGSSIDFGNQTWGISGAPESLGEASVASNGYCAVIWKNSTAVSSDNPNPYIVSQLLTIPDVSKLATANAEFGYSVTISKNERWIYVGAPGINTVYAFGRVDLESQEITYTPTGPTTNIYFGDDIKITAQAQLDVLVNNATLTYGVDYTVDVGLTTITFITSNLPTTGDSVIIRRSTNTQFTGDGSTTSYQVASKLFGADNEYGFTLGVDGEIQRLNIDYFYSSGSVIFYSAPAAGAEISVITRSYFKYVSRLTPPSYNVGDRFGHSIVCNTVGDQVIIGSKNAAVNSLSQAGSVYVFNRNVQKFIRQDELTNVYTVLGSPVEPIEVVVNNQYLINQSAASPQETNTFTVSGSNVTINETLNVGDVIEISTNNFVLQQIVTQNTVADFSNFGQAVDLCPLNCSLYVGAPQSSISAFKGGVVQRSVAQDRVYGTITATVANPSLNVGDTVRVNNVDCSVTNADTLVTSVQELANNINLYAPNATASVDTNGYITISVTNTNSAPAGNKLQVEPGSVGNAYEALGFKSFVYTQTIESPLPKDYAAFGAALAINSNSTNLVVGAPQGTLYLPTTFDYNTATQMYSTTFDGNSTSFYSPVVQSGAVYTFDYLSSATDTAINPGLFVFGQQISNPNIQPYDNYGSSVVFNSGVVVAGAPYNDFNQTLSNSGAAWVFQNPNQTPAWAVIHQQQPVVDIYSLNSVFMYDRITSAATEFFDFFDPLQGKILGAAQQNLDYTGAVDPAFYNVGAVNNIGNTWTSAHVGEMWWDTSTVRFIDPNQDNIVYASRRWGQVFPGSSVDVYQWVESSTPPASYVGSGTPRSVNSYVINTYLNKNGLFSTTYYFWVKNVTETYTQQGKTLNANIVAQYIENPRASGIAYIAPVNASTVAIYNGLGYLSAADTILSIEFDKTLTDANVHSEYELIAQGRPDAFLSDSLYKKMQDSFCGTDTSGNLVPSPNLPASQRYGIQIRPRQSMFVDRYAALKNYITKVNSVLVLYPISESRSFTLLNSQEPVPPATVLVDNVSITVWNKSVDNLEILSFQNIYEIPLGYKYLVLSDSNNRGYWTIYTVELLPQIFTPVPAGTFKIGNWYEILTPGNTDWAAIGATSSAPGTLFQATGVGSGTGTAVPADRHLVLSRVQNYKTSTYWSYIDWYLPGYNSSTKVYYEVPNYADLAALNVPVGTSVKVTANQLSKFEIYLLTDIGWERVGLQDGTIAISSSIYDYSVGRFGFDVEVFDAQYFDEYPATETRKIIQAINEQLLIDELLIERNRALTLMFDFILSEQEAPEWLVKTSLIDVNHKIRQLLPFQNYIRDNQDFVIDYLQEVKPYHVQVREFNLSYDGLDEYFGDVTDFDVPAYYDSALDVPQFVSPILTNELAYTHAQAQQFNNLSDTASNSALWLKWPYNQWYDNFLLSLGSIRVVDQGYGYIEAPTVSIVGDAATPATAVAVINSLGKVVDIIVTDPGSGYQETPTIVITSATGTGARAYPVMVNGLVRSFKTVIKYDRYQYQTTILTWNPSTTYVNGQLVRFDDRVWTPKTTAGPSEEFLLGDWNLINPGTTEFVYDEQQGYYVPVINISGVDRTMGFYTPNANEPGLQLSLLIDGVDYPGVQVYGRDFVYTDPLDTIYASSFTDQYLGLRPTDINVDGAKFVDIYEGHAPEELVNGSEYDTLDLRVYTRPGSDWDRNGHGFGFNSISYTVDTDIATDFYSWASLVQNPAQVLVSDVSTGRDLTPGIDYNIDWVNKTVEIINNSLIGTTINITAYEVGGGSQLYRAYYTGSQAGSSVVIPVNSAEIGQVAVFVDGQAQTTQTWEPYAPHLAWVITNTYQFKDVVTSNNLYYRALKNVPAGISINNVEYWLNFVPTQLSTLYFNAIYPADSGIAIVVLGNPTIYESDQPYDSTKFDFGENTGFPGSYDYGQPVNPNPYSWSTPQVQYIVSDGSQTLTLTNSIEGTNPANLIVTRNGLRLTPPAGICWLGAEGSGYSVGGYDENGFDDGSIFGLPQRMGYSFSQATINAATDVKVWVDSILQTQGVDYFVTPYTGTNDRNVVFPNAVPQTALVTISVSTIADYQVLSGDPNTIVLVTPPNIGDVFAVTTWNDTQQQDICTLVFVGPVDNSDEIIINEPFDSTPYSDTPGSPIEWSLTTTLIDTNPTNGSSAVFQAANIDYALVSANPSILSVYYEGVLQTGNYTLSAGSPGTDVTFYMPTEPFDSVPFDEGNTNGTSIFPDGSFDYDFLPPPAGNVVTITATFDTTFLVDQIVYVLPANPLLPPTFYIAIQNVPAGVDITNTVYWAPIDYVDIPGSFDYTQGQFIPANNFYLDRPGITANRLWVTLDGYRLFEGQDFTVENDYLILASGTISPSQTLVVTEFTESIVPDAMAFRIFQDMRGVQATYRITEPTSTVLAQDLAQDADVIVVENAQHLSVPNLPAGIFGVITIGGERIMYREIDLGNNTISSLLRGTAGTAAAAHAAGVPVYDMGRGNLMPVDQNYITYNTSMADGLTDSFAAADIDYNSLIGENTDCVEVYVGGILQRDNYIINPSAQTTQQNNFDILNYSLTPYSAEEFLGIMITLDYVPAAGLEVTILVRHGTWWYDVSTQYTRSLSLQETNTTAARFLRGL